MFPSPYPPWIDNFSNGVNYISPLLEDLSPLPEDATTPLPTNCRLRRDSNLLVAGKNELGGVGLTVYR